MVYSFYLSQYIVQRSTISSYSMYRFDRKHLKKNIKSSIHKNTTFLLSTYIGITNMNESTVSRVN